MPRLPRSAATFGLVLLTLASLALTGLALRPRSAPPPAVEPSPAWTAADPQAATPRAPASPAPTGTTSTADAAPAVTVAAYGDSVTTGGAPVLSSASPDPRSWTAHLAGSGLRLAGGVGIARGTTTRVAQAARPLAADRYVTLLGLADAYGGGTAPQQVRVLEGLAQRLGVARSPRFVVVALGPADRLPPAGLAAWNRTLQQAAAAHGWTWIDPWARLRTPAFTWADPADRSSASVPSETGARKLAGAIAAGLRRP